MSSTGDALPLDGTSDRRHHGERRDRPSRQVSVHPIAVDVALDAGDPARGRPLPDRVPLARPAIPGNVGRVHVPVRDPERMPSAPEPRRVPHEAAPEVVARVDHRSDTRPGLHAVQPRLGPGSQLLGREPSGLFDVEDGKHIPRGHVGHTEEMIGFVARIPGGEVGLGEVIGAHDQPVLGRARVVPRVPSVLISVPERRAHDDEADGRGGDRRPVDPPLVLGDVDAVHPGARQCGHCPEGCEERDRGDGNDEDGMPPASRDPPHGYPPPRSPSTDPSWRGR